MSRSIDRGVFDRNSCSGGCVCS